jgi:hypothetical protein
LKWLVERMPKATEAQKSVFIEKVAIVNLNINNEEEARNHVLAWMWGT